MPGLHEPLIWAVAVGVLVSLGLFLAASSLVPRTARLSDALAVLDAAEPDELVVSERLDPESSSWDQRLGHYGYARLHVPVTSATRRRLELRGRSISEFVAEKLLLGLAGLMLPQLYLVLRLLLFGRLTMMPMIVSLALMVLGFFWPDIALRRSHEAVREDVSQQLLSFFDLVTLERLANQSAIASLQAAADMSDTVVFRRVRGALDRARLEQRAPWTDLERVASDLSLPELHDLVDVLRLDEQGAALADALRARVKELRDAHLLREKVAAQATSESMTLWMVIPSFMTGVLLIAPPILRMTGLG